MEKISVVVVDDLEIMRKYYQQVLNNSDSCICIGVADTESTAIAIAKELHPDIVLLDIQMETPDSGIQVIPDILEASPGTKIIMLTSMDNDGFVYNAIRIGANEYILKTSTPNALIDTIINVYSNNNYLRKSTTNSLQNVINHTEKKYEELYTLFPKFFLLTKTEFEILRSLYNGFTVAQISEERFLAQTSIRKLISSILKKLSYKNTKNMLNSIKKLELFDIFDKN